MKRIHWQISKLYMADDKSKLERAILDYWGEENIILNHNKYRLTTSDNRVYISKPDGDFFEVDTSVKTNDDTIYRKSDSKECAKERE